MNMREEIQEARRRANEDDGPLDELAQQTRDRRRAFERFTLGTPGARRRFDRYRRWREKWATITGAWELGHRAAHRSLAVAGWLPSFVGWSLDFFSLELQVAPRAKLRLHHVRWLPPENRRLEGWEWAIHLPGDCIRMLVQEPTWRFATPEQAADSCLEAYRRSGLDRKWRLPNRAVKWVRYYWCGLRVWLDRAQYQLRQVARRGRA